MLRINVAYNRQWLPIIRNDCNASESVNLIPLLLKVSHFGLLKMVKQHLKLEIFVLREYVSLHLKIFVYSNYWVMGFSNGTVIRLVDLKLTREFGISPVLSYLKELVSFQDGIEMKIQSIISNLKRVKCETLLLCQLKMFYLIFSYGD